MMQARQLNRATLVEEAINFCENLRTRKEPPARRDNS